MTGTIYINGIIGEDYKLQDALMDLAKNKINDSIVLKIGSNGGYIDIAEEIYTAFKNSGKVIQTENSGNVASAAVKIFMLAPKEARFFDPTKGIFLIHNPLGENLSGDSSLFELVSKELGKLENDFINFYSNETGTDKEVISGFMKINEPLTVEQIEALGFATIKTNQFQAVAKLNINHKKENEMDETKLNGFLAKLDALFTNVGKKFGFKNLMVQDANGKNLDFGTQIEQVEQIYVGMTAVYEDGTKPVGEVVMPDGAILVFDENSVITEIKEAEQPADNPELEALKTENENLKAELEALKNVDIEAKAKMKAEEMIKEYKAEITSKYVALLEERDEKQEPQDQPKKFVFGGKKQN